MTLALLARASHKPFEHAVLESVLTQRDQDLILTWLESTDTWQLSTKDFYEQYEFSLEDSPPPPSCQYLTATVQVAAIRTFLETAFDCRLEPVPEITTHKLLPGQTIQIHNDFLEHGERCRFLVQLNRSWALEDGGVLMLFESGATQVPAMLIPPLSGSGFAFRISSGSLHAVSTVHRGERFTLVYSFYDRE